MLVRRFTGEIENLLECDLVAGSDQRACTIEGGSRDPESDGMG